MDEPFIGASPIVRWAISKEVKKKGFKVLLNGEGSDEIFLGYNGSSPYLIADLIKNFRLRRAIIELKSGSKKINWNIARTVFLLLAPNIFRKILSRSNASKRKETWGLKLDFRIDSQLRTIGINIQISIYIDNNLNQFYHIC